MKDTFGLVPDQVRARIDEQDTVERHANQALALRAALKAHDEHLSVVWVKDLPEEVRPLGTLPGRWHVENRKPGVLPTYTPITTEDGGYREPDFGVLYAMQERDMQTHRDGLTKALAKRDKDKARREKDAALKSEQRVDEMKADYRAARRVAGESIHRRRWGQS